MVNAIKMKASGLVSVFNLTFFAIKHLLNRRNRTYFVALTMEAYTVNVSAHIEMFLSRNF